jgi:uncharacterized SAM-binding protein YcdF (DUF218 family)
MNEDADGPRWIRRHRGVLIGIGAIVVLAMGWVWAAGRVLVREDEPGSPQVVFSLSGDPLGDRLRAAADVMQRTQAERLVVMTLGEGGIYDWREDAERFLMRRGIAPEAVRFLGPVASTADEASLAAGYVERCGFTEVAVATSDYHTRRAGWLFERAMGDDVGVSVVAVDQPWFDAGSWWRTDTGREVVLLEWMKGLSSSPYLLGGPDPTGSDVPC